LQQYFSLHLYRAFHSTDDDGTTASFVLHQRRQQQAADERWNWPHKAAVRKCYNHYFTQTFVAFLILLSFLTVVLRTDDRFEEHWSLEIWYADVIFAVFFTLEFGVNFYSCYSQRFFISPWNIIDIFVVIISWGALCSQHFYPEEPVILRIVRAFFALRSVKRLLGLRDIMESVTRALPSVLYAMALLIVLMSVCSVIAVELFNCDWNKNNQDDCKFFGTFFRSILSFVQITTMDNWSSGLAKPMVERHGVNAGFFLVSYNYVSGIIFVNIVIAIFISRFDVKLKTKMRRRILRTSLLEGTDENGGRRSFYSSQRSFYSSQQSDGERFTDAQCSSQGDMIIDREEIMPGRARASKPDFGSGRAADTFMNSVEMAPIRQHGRVGSDLTEQICALDVQGMALEEAKAILLRLQEELQRTRAPAGATLGSPVMPRRDSAPGALL